MRLVIGACLAVFLGGCNPTKSRTEAEGAVVDFHAKFSAADFEGIYNAAHRDFQSSQPKDDIVAFIRTVRSRLGPVVSSKLSSWSSMSQNLSTTVTISYNTVFENGTGSEQFIYQIEEAEAKLLSWNITSNQLIHNKNDKPSQP
ncbi:hypothetical protein HAHE_25250 [Haloferula helveola]|uniref:DUF4019 domain-containing protein n=1 Tax=Haloferula helveola TaxID=490095 RepID=A0ABM7RGW1_9BACT|nr:hypothetical protein HAHE_25250 [Haloferula helveola]